MSDEMEPAERVLNGWESVEAKHASISLREGNIVISDTSEDAELMAQPSDVDFSIGDDPKPGEVRLSLGSESHGFRVTVAREQFERIISACCDEWGYEIGPADTDADE